MATFSRIKIWVSNEVLTAAALNTEFDNILNNMNPPGVEDASANVAAMQASVNPGGLGTESLATSLLGELQRLRYVIKRMVALDLSKEWYESPTRSFADLNVATADIEDGAVTPIKLSTKNLQTSTVVTGNSQSTTSSSFTDVGGLSVSITTVGRPVRVYLVGKGGVGGPASISCGNTAGSSLSSVCRVALLRGSTIVSDNYMHVSQNATASGANPISASWPVSSVCTIDAPAAGTYTYKVQFRVASTNTQVDISGDVYLVAEEIS